jgi:hypothetical protein
VAAAPGGEQRYAGAGFATFVRPLWNNLAEEDVLKRVEAALDISAQADSAFELVTGAVLEAEAALE